MPRSGDEAAHCSMMRSNAAFGGSMMRSNAAPTVNRWKPRRHITMLRSCAVFGGGMLRSDAALGAA